MVEAPSLKADDLEVDRGRRCVWRAGEVIDLPRLSFEFLVALIDAAPAVVTHDELVAQVWRNHFVSPETIAQRAHLLRVSLGDSANEPRYVAAVRGIGYRWMTPVTATAHTNGAAVTPPRPRWLRYCAGAVAGATVVTAVGVGYAQHRDARWATEEAVPAMEAAIEADDFGAAFDAANALEARVGQGYVSPKRWNEMSVTASLRSMPEGARVSYRRYESEDQPWIPLGETPIDTVRLPRDVVVFNVEKTGYASLQRADYPPGTYPPDAVPQATAQVVTFELQSADRVPSEMVWVPPSSAPRLPPVLRQHFDVAIPGFLIDRFEATNRDYQAFVDAGGYTDARYWQDLEFIDDERVLDLQTALKRFVDATGRPGPAGWQLGKYPAGAADLPVTGVSWFEAAAYARFRGKALPTVHHWRRAIGDSIAAPMTRFGNFTGRVQSVGHSGGLGPYGTYDMVGNVAEWVSNVKGAGHLVSGGATTDAPYVLDGVAQSAWDRTKLTGIRCATYVEPPPEPLFADLPIDELPPLPAPMPDAELDAAARALSYRSFAAAPRPIGNVQLGDIPGQRISLSDGEGEGRFDVYVFEPNDATPPYQPVLYFGGDYGFARGGEFEAQFRWDLNVFEPVLRSGRAVVWPVWYGTYSRYDGIAEISNMDDLIAAYQNRLRAWRRETAAILDYLGASPRFSAKVAWLGLSYGAAVPVSMTYHFPSRFGAAILLSGSDLIDQPWQVTLYRRLQVPVLMLNGRYDSIVMKGTAQRFYDGLGTPAADKRLVLYETGHWPLPRNETAREISDWLDRYLGPVEHDAIRD